MKRGGGSLNLGGTLLFLTTSSVPSYISLTAAGDTRGPLLRVKTRSHWIVMSTLCFGENVNEIYDGMELVSDRFYYYECTL